MLMLLVSLLRCVPHYQLLQHKPHNRYTDLWQHDSFTIQRCLWALGPLAPRTPANMINQDSGQEVNNQDKESALS